MNIEFMGLKSDVNGSLIALDGVTDACYEEMVEHNSRRRRPPRRNV